MFENILIGGLVAVILLMTLIGLRLEAARRRYSYKETPSSVKESPTVSVCIPARNETHAMTTCLERILSSDYERLEIIVLDDSSVDNTSVLIKSFAHEGVRFVEGSPLPTGWLGKNHALQGLLEEASGSFVLFLDVDTIIHPDTISRLVAEAARQKTSFLSVMPERQDGLRASVFLGTLRYFWPLFLPTQAAGLPTSGSCIFVNRAKLIQLGSFEGTSGRLEPEVEIAHRFRQAGEEIGYVISNASLGVSYEKKWSSQVETSIRLLKPLFGSSLKALLVAAIALSIVVLPIIGLLWWLTSSSILVGIVSTISLFVTTGVSFLYFRMAWRYGWWLGALHWPYTLLQEATLITLSIFSYASGMVTWKGRPLQARTRV